MLHRLGNGVGNKGLNMDIPKLSDLSTPDRRELFSFLRVAITHHSNKMESTTLNYGETKRLLELGETAPNKPLSDQLVILGFADAFDEVVYQATSQKPITSTFIKDIHALLFRKALIVTPDKVEKTVGAYRRDERYITGLDKPLSSPLQISNHLENLLFSSKVETIEDIAKFHIDFELIHPFADGNGRVGRLIMIYQTIQNDLIPPLIQDEHRGNYLQSLHDSHNHAEFLKEAQYQSYQYLLDIHKQQEISSHDPSDDLVM